MGIIFQQSENSTLLAVRELKIYGDLYRCLTEFVGFINGIPLMFLDPKNTKSDLRKYDIQKLRKIAVDLLQKVKAKITELDYWTDKHEQKLLWITSSWIHFENLR